MELVYYPIYILGLLAFAIVALWLAMFKLNKKVTFSDSDLDTDFVKKFDRADIHKSRPLYFGIALFIVGFFTYHLLTANSETIYVEPAPKEMVNFGFADIPVIPEPEEPEVLEPPKVTVTEIKTVEKLDTPPPVDTTSTKEEEGFFDPEDDDEEGGEEESLPGPEKEVFVEKITRKPTYKNGGDGGFQKAMYAHMISDLESFKPGAHPYIFEYTINEKGGVESVKLLLALSKSPQFNDKVFAGAKSINQWNPGLKDGVPTLMKIKKKFTIMIK